MTSPPLIRVSFELAQANAALVPMPRQQGAPLVWRSAAVPPFDDLLNLDGYIMIDVVGGAAGQVEILHLDKARVQSGPANDTGQLHRMFVDLSNATPFDMPRLAMITSIPGFGGGRSSIMASREQRGQPVE